ncbi:MAG: hypothetical protein BWY77_01874 [bacterium ADurb.Bin431]|nr:MAG: hypothetical protein BWY77_01874 [bacterium ADurb.Bin431]
MELEELHVLEGQAGAVGQGHAVAGDRLRVGGETVEGAAAAGADDQGLAADEGELAGGHVHRRQAAELAFGGENGGDEELVVVGGVVVLEQGVIEGLQLEKAGLVGGEDRAGIAVAAEGALGDAAVLAAGPGNAPVVELEDFAGHGVDKAVHHILIGEKVAPLDGIPGVQLEAVAILGAHHRGGAALGRDRVGAHHLVLGDHRNVDLALGLA